MEEAKKRFVSRYRQDQDLEQVVILVDTETGINYLFFRYGPAGGLTPLLGSDGKPIISAEFISAL